MAAIFSAVLARELALIYCCAGCNLAIGDFVVKEKFVLCKHEVFVPFRATGQAQLVTPCKIYKIGAGIQLYDIPRMGAIAPDNALYSFTPQISFLTKIQEAS